MPSSYSTPTRTRRQKITSSRQSHSFVKRRKEKSIIVIGCLIVIVISGMYCLDKILSFDMFTIDSVKVYGADPDVAPLIQARAQKQLEGNYLGFVPRASYLFYPRSAVAVDIHNVSPRIDKVEVGREGHSLAITVTDKIAASIVCDDLPDFSSGDSAINDDGSCWYADSSGFIFQDVLASSTNTYNRYYIPSLSDDATSTHSLEGLFATSTTEFPLWQSLYSDLKSHGIAVEAMLVKDAGEYELYVKNPHIQASALGNVATSSPDSDTAVIYFNEQRPLLEQAQNLIDFWAHKVSEAQSKKEQVRFEYVDVRYGSNVFYR